MGRSKLKTALKAEKGIDIKKLKEKRRLKQKASLTAKKTGVRGGAKKAPKDVDEDEDEDDVEEEEEDDEDTEGGALVVEEADDSDDDDEDDDEDVDEAEPAIDLAALDESSDDSSVDFEEKIERPKKPKQTKTKTNGTAPPTPKPSKKTTTAEEGEEEDDEEEDENEEDEEIEWADLPPEEREDLVPRTRISINNTVGLLNTLKRFGIPTDDSVPFASHQSLASKDATADVIGEDLQDDIKRELAFYAQSLDAAKRGRALLKAEGVPFSRPTDYFAEMVKDDGHMEKVKAKLIEEASAKKASAEARKLRDLKKFGKQVQVAKLQERAKEKRDTLEKIKILKRSTYFLSIISSIHPSLSCPKLDPFYLITPRPTLFNQKKSHPLTIPFTNAHPPQQSDQKQAAVTSARARRISSMLASRMS
jgi:rRNA-processing protein EBP2